jgi:hypothetical protein
MKRLCFVLVIKIAERGSNIEGNQACLLEELIVE